MEDIVQLIDPEHAIVAKSLEGHRYEYHLVTREGDLNPIVSDAMSKSDVSYLVDGSLRMMNVVRTSYLESRRVMREDADRETYFELRTNVKSNLVRYIKHLGEDDRQALDMILMPVPPYIRHLSNHLDGLSGKKQGLCPQTGWSSTGTWKAVNSIGSLVEKGELDTALAQIRDYVKLPHIHAFDLNSWTHILFTRTLESGPYEILRALKGVLDSKKMESGDESVGYSHLDHG